MNLTGAIYNALVSSQPLADLLSQYGGHPAIFSQSPIPEGAELPYVVIDPPWSNEPDETMDNKELFVVNRDIRIYFPASGSEIEIRQAAWLVRGLIHRQPLQTDGTFRILSARAAGPVGAPSDENVYGRLVSCRFVIAKEE